MDKEGLTHHLPGDLITYLPSHPPTPLRLQPGMINSSCYISLWTGQGKRVQPGHIPSDIYRIQ